MFSRVQLQGSRNYCHGGIVDFQGLTIGWCQRAIVNVNGQSWVAKCDCRHPKEIASGQG